jgi:hypothetical protein
MGYVVVRADCRLKLAVALVSLLSVSCSTSFVLQTTPPEHSRCLHARVAGSIGANAHDPARVWLDRNDGRRVDLRWPSGFRAQFTPSAEVMDGGGRVIARQGDAVTLGGGYVDGIFEVCSIVERSHAVPTVSEVRR